jgi:4-amino-4-deoxy-L-arabinose transferase-like glycosyltransferase
MKKSSIAVVLMLSVALFLRIFRTSDLMGFYYDQGRDALVIWDLIHHHKPFLIGPTTGIEGIFLGPFYYYLIAPFYALGNGNPVFPSVELAIINVLAIAILYYIGSRYFTKATGLLAVFLVTISANLISAHRWLSNPTPLPLFALLAVLSLLKIIHGQKSWWPLLGVSIGLGLQLEAASAIFFIPASLIILLIFFRNFKSNLKFISTGIALFGATLLPQLYFDFRHGHILLQGFKNFIFSPKSAQPTVLNFLSVRLGLYFDNFSRILFLDKITSLFAAVLLLFLLVKLFSIFPKKPFFSILIWWATPLLFLLFYQGNNGYVWGYYFTGVYPVFMLIVSAVAVTAFQKYKTLRPILTILFILFFFQNISRIRADLFQPTPASISLTTSTETIDWIYQNSSGQDFNLDAYVPPVIPYSYQYLALWRGTESFNRLPKNDLTQLFYTIYEPDLERPKNLEQWLRRQDTYGSVNAIKQYGSVTVQRRSRI